MKPHFWFILTACCAVQLLFNQVHSQTLLRHLPIVMAHDAATTYLSLPTVLRELQDWTQTQQPGNFTMLLNCGTRGLDIRVEVNGQNRIVMHHGKVAVNVLLQDAMKEVVDWGSSHPNELIVVLVSAFLGENAVAHTAEMLQREFGIRLHSDCGTVNAWTVEEAMKQSETNSHAHVLVIQGCINSQYDPNVECARVQKAMHPSPPRTWYTRDVAAKLQTLNTKDVAITHTMLRSTPLMFPYEYVCYGVESHQPEIPLHRFDEYMERSTSSKGACSQQSLWMAQGHWQYSTSSVAAGVLLGSSILKDSSRSKLNSRIWESIQSNKYNCMNILGLDSVCDADAKRIANFYNSARKFLSMDYKKQDRSNDVQEFVSDTSKIQDISHDTRSLK